MCRLRVAFGIMVLWLLISPPEIFAQRLGPTPVPVHEVETELEYLAPVDKDRQIETVSFNLLMPRHRHQTRRNSTSYLGLTLTRPWGSINTSYLDPDSSAFGLGPVYLIRRQWWQQGRWQFVSEFSGALILYSDNFPAGGDIYNFMWRFGPKLIYRVNDQLAWSIGYKLIHVSNGQLNRKVPSRNPSYNAGGLSLGLQYRF